MNNEEWDTKRTDQDMVDFGLAVLFWVLVIILCAILYP